MEVRGEPPTSVWPLRRAIRVTGSALSASVARSRILDIANLAVSDDEGANTTAGTATVGRYVGAPMAVSPPTSPRPGQPLVADLPCLSQIRPKRTQRVNTSRPDRSLGRRTSCAATETGNLSTAVVDIRH